MSNSDPPPVPNTNHPKFRKNSPRRREVKQMYPKKLDKFSRVGFSGASPFGQNSVADQGRCFAYVNKQRKVIAGVGIAMVVMLYMYGGTVKRKFGLGRFSGVPRDIEVATWNVAAINNNPFEYWVTMDDNPKYNKMMDNVQQFINEPGKSNDIVVSKIFTQSMFSELVDEMRKSGMEKEHINTVKQMWNKDYSKRQIVSRFLLDPVLGLKRLVSMPDRISNTINTGNGEVPVYRPTVIDCYSDSQLASISEWWGRWKEYMFVRQINQKDGSSATVAQMLQPIKKAKYPDITETEERVSIPLQTLALGIFDAIMVHMANKVEPEWALIRTSICEALNLKKNEHTLDIINKAYGDQDVFFLQEVSTSFIDTLKTNKEISTSYTVVEPETLGKRDQNSIILLRRSLFDADTIVEHTTQLDFGENVKPVSNGDILVITVDDHIGNKLMFASFHGDTNGLATIPVVTTVHKLAQSMTPRPMLIFGLDANTYQHSKPGKTQDVLGFAKFYRSLGLTSCWGDTPDPGTYTTYNARTYLQPQLNKAAKKEEVRVKGDVNPKDFVLFYKGDLSALRVARDNTGERKYVENMVFPTLTFPSDHGVLSTTLA